ncbi:uncharacterized protein EV422DRAFT_522251 [Fimicolochytrium jonesii]|uniref:uncharacterized protein n=1 Tax=Fimicolochytrium jonesii TaxID=1396493 RepID=UPI0022FEB938|nr:uncharacterized protein EV422DRAFT_522251 [Fimicolochytrium jonesii]KAI8823761.1 hypothetical protein EV422DRAFT_522251 [Fimicolochytrium jonesii]
MLTTVQALVKLSRAQFCVEPILRTIVAASAYAHDHHTPLNLHSLLITSTLIALFLIALNYYNDYDDYEGDLANTKRADSPSTGGAGVLVAGTLPRWSALLASVSCVTLAGVLILTDRALHPETTPFRNQTLVAGLLFMALGSQYNAGLRLAYTPFNEFLTTSTLSIGTWLFGYNTQSPDASFTLPHVATSIVILDAVLQFSRILTMMVVDTEADRFIGKLTFACTLGVKRTAQLYLNLQYLLAALAVYFAYTSTSPVERALVGVLAAIAVPQNLGVAKELAALGEGKEGAAKDAPFVVSKVMVETNLAMLAVFGVSWWGA